MKNQDEAVKRSQSLANAKQVATTKRDNAIAALMRLGVSDVSRYKEIKAAISDLETAEEALRNLT